MRTNRNKLIIGRLLGGTFAAAALMLVSTAVPGDLPRALADQGPPPWRPGDPVTPSSPPGRTFPGGSLITGGDNRLFIPELPYLRGFYGTATDNSWGNFLRDYYHNQPCPNCGQQMDKTGPRTSLPSPEHQPPLSQRYSSDALLSRLTARRAANSSDAFDRVMPEPGVELVRVWADQGWWR